MDPRDILNRFSSLSRGGAMSISCNGVEITSHGSSYSVTMNGFKYKRIEVGASAEFTVDKSMAREYKNTLLKAYEAYTTCLSEKINETSVADSLSLIERVVKSYNPSFSIQLADPSQPIRRDLQSIEKVRKVIKEIVYQQIEATGKLFIKENNFKEDLDDAHRHVIRIFVGIFEEILREEPLTKEKLTEAFEIAKKIQNCREGGKAFCSLAEKWLHFKPGKEDTNYVNALICLNAAGVSEHDAIVLREEDVFSFCERVEEPVLVLLASGITHREMKASITNFLFLRYIARKDWSSLNNLIKFFEDEYQQKEMCEKIIDFYLSLPDLSLKERASLAFRAMMLSKKRPGEKIITSLLAENEIALALEIIRHLEEKFSRNNEYRKIIDIYLKRGDIPRALSTINLLESKFEENNEYRKIIDIYVKRGEISNALPIISRLQSDFEENQEYKKIADLYLKNKAFKEAAEFIGKIDSEYTRKEEYKKLTKPLVQYFEAARLKGEKIDSRAILQNVLPFVRDRESVTLLKGALFDYMY